MTNERNDFLKLFAALFMVLDHVGAIFFPFLLYLRIPGRLSFPIFAYYTALGAENTKRPLLYFAKLLGVGILTQPIYSALLPGHLNILFTLLYGAIIVYLFRQKKGLCSLLAICLLGGSLFLDTLDYGVYGILTILGFYFVGNEGFIVCLLFQGMLQIVNHYLGSHVIQACSLLAVPIIYAKRLPYVTLPRYFFYVFYPLHLVVLWIIRIL